MIRKAIYIIECFSLIYLTQFAQKNFYSDKKLLIKYFNNLFWFYTSFESNKKFGFFLVFRRCCTQSWTPTPYPVPERFFQIFPDPNPAPKQFENPVPRPEKVSGFSGYTPNKKPFLRKLKRKILKIPSQFTLRLLFLKEK